MEIVESLEVFPSTLPAKRDSAYSGWVSISVGCNNTCTFCIVPSLRGTEKDRRPGEILAEVQALVDQGVLEVTLLGQNVNAYGVEFRDRGAFADLLRSAGRIEGLERIRFTSPHPREFTDDVIHAMAETPAVCHQLHMPLQSGSDDVLRRMRRGYRQERYLGIIDRVRAAMPDAAITTDIIVGFPGETEADFEQTLDVVRQARFASAFTFQYSKRPGTPAAEMDGQLPKDVVQERYLRLTALQDEISWAENRALVGRQVELLVAAGEGSKDAATGRLSGRARDGRLVHFTAADGVRPGDVVETVVTDAKPHFLVADGALLSHRRTRAGDASEAGTRPSTPGILLGMPQIGAPGARSGRGLLTGQRRAADFSASASHSRRVARLAFASSIRRWSPAASALASCSSALVTAARIEVTIGFSGAVRARELSVAPRTFCSTACMRSSSERMTPRGHVADRVVALLDLPQRVLGPAQVGGRVELLGLGQQLFLQLLVGLLLAGALLVRLGAGREEDVLRRAELLPEVVVAVATGARHRLPAVHQRPHGGAGRAPVGGGRQLLRLLDELLLGRARLAALGVERGEVRAAAATERVTGGGEPRPQRLVGLAVDAADRLPLLDDRLQPVAGGLPGRGLGGDLLRLGGQRLLAGDLRRRGRPAFSARDSAAARVGRVRPWRGPGRRARRGRRRPTPWGSTRRGPAPCS